MKGILQLLAILVSVAIILALALKVSNATDHQKRFESECAPYMFVGYVEEKALLICAAPDGGYTMSTVRLFP